jgi:hypothetical protein
MRGGVAAGTVDRADLLAYVAQLQAENADARLRTAELLAAAADLCSEAGAGRERRARLRRERQRPRSAERRGELGEDCQVGVQSDPLDASDAER